MGRRPERHTAAWHPRRRVWFSPARYERIERTTIGLPIDLKATVDVGIVGLGLNLFADVNLRGSFAGLALTLQAGKLH